MIQEVDFTFRPGANPGMKEVCEDYEGDGSPDSIIAWIVDQRQRHGDIRVEWNEEHLYATRKVPFTEAERRLNEAKAAWLAMPMKLISRIEKMFFMQGYFDKMGWERPDDETLLRW